MTGRTCACGLAAGFGRRASRLDLIRTAHQRGSYDTRDIVGGPDWLATTRFDVIALAGADVRLVDASGFPAPMFAMLRALLEERFQLRVHNEQRDAAVYALTLTPSNDSSRLRLTTLDCADVGCRQAQGTLPRNVDGPPPCMAATPRGRITGTGMTSAGLANILGTIVGRPVVDRTALAGSYDIDVRYRPDDAPTDDLPSIFTAVEEQLGLKLQPTRARVDVLVIDSAEMPVEN